MPTYWYARSATDPTPSGPYFEEKDAVPVDDDAGERLRPIDDSVLPDGAEVRGESEPTESLGDLSHDELKERARESGIAEETDLRSKDSIIDALQSAE